MPDDVRPRVVAVAVAVRRAVGVQLGPLGRALHVGDRLERLVLDAIALGRAARLLGVLGGDERDRLAEVADAVDREHGLVAELEPVALLAGDVVVREHGVDAGHRRAPREMSIERMRACACGLRTVWPQSIPGAQVARERELALDLRGAVGARQRVADAADLEPASRAS